MAELNINKNKCVGCGNCIKACPTCALFLQEDKAVVDEEKCILCSMCIDTCPYDAISLETKKCSITAADTYSGVWVFVEQHVGEIKPVSYELLGKGRELADRRKSQLTAVILGNHIRQTSKELIARGADRVIFCDHEKLGKQHDEYYANALTTILSGETPEIFLFGATSFGRSLAPRIAARLQTGLTADCTQLEIDEETGCLHQTRPAFGGNLMATIVCPEHRPQMATVRPGVMKALDIDENRNGQLIEVNYRPDISENVEILNEVNEEAAETIADAPIIISAGRGIGSHKNMALVNRLASLMGAQVGVSRPLVDTGWSEYRHQIGQTGAVVAPKLLITCGISGAIQHLAGISGAHTIIAINSDPEAPIFSVAHYKIVGDCVEVLKRLIAEMETKQN